MHGSPRDRRVCDIKKTFSICRQNDPAQSLPVGTAVARAVAKAAVADAVAPVLTDDQIDRAIDRTRWLPRYQSDHRAVSR
jgi:malic enzyme